MEMIWLQLLPTVMTVFALISAVVFMTDFPDWVKVTLLYGKGVKGISIDHWFFGKLVISKSLFSHFYMYSSLLHLALLVIYLRMYLFGIDLPVCMNGFLDPDTRQTPESVTIALTLMTIQCLRRLYECHLVNRPSEAKIHAIHYLMGFVHYSNVGLGIICRSPNAKVGLHWANISTIQLLAIGIFFWAFKHQYVAHKIFAESRTETGGYGIPEGDWFDYVSSPHYTAECLIYFSLLLVLGLSHQTWIFVLVFVLVNQTILALISHQWFLQNCQKRHRHKKALIPYIL